MGADILQSHVIVSYNVSISYNSVIMLLDISQKESKTWILKCCIVQVSCSKRIHKLAEAHLVEYYLKLKELGSQDTKGI